MPSPPPPSVIWYNRIVKKCKRCGKEKALTSFRKDRGKRGITCNTCIWAARSPEAKKRANRRTHLRRMYDMSPAEWDDMFANQSGLCAICCSDGEELVVDHNQDTGKVRGLLCRTCNLGLGFFKDNLNNLIKAQQYLVQG